LDGAPTALCRLDEFERHRDPGGGAGSVPNIREVGGIQLRVSPAEVEALTADEEDGGPVGELARYGIHRTAVSAHMGRAGKTRGQLTAAQVGEGVAALCLEGSPSKSNMRMLRC
jgi:hypothetical protein